MKLSFLMLLFLLAGCSQPETTNTYISKIEFKLHADKEDSATFADGIEPWINLDTPNKQIDSLIDPDEIVLPFNKVTLIIDYPLTNKAVFDIEGTGNGFSRKQLILLISKKYHEIYKEEESSASTKTVPADERKGLLNRNLTNGKYGVCCHDLSDLDLSYIEVYKNTLGEIFLVLDVES
ncbi:MAG: hypothetical protein ACHQIM_10655 [Sphingobacteriales bacterium]